MVIHESFVTRKPLEFTLIVLFVIFLLLLPVYFYTRNYSRDAVEEAEFIPESYEEVAFLFSQDSDLSDSDKKNIFKFKYEDNMVQWGGILLSCELMTPLYRVSVDETGDGFGDVLFTTDYDCTHIPIGSRLEFNMTLIDRKTRMFIGLDGEIIGWD